MPFDNNIRERQRGDDPYNTDRRQVTNVVKVKNIALWAGAGLALVNRNEEGDMAVGADPCILERAENLQPLPRRIAL